MKLRPLMLLLTSTLMSITTRLSMATAGIEGNVPSLRCENEYSFLDRQIRQTVPKKTSVEVETSSLI